MVDKELTEFARRILKARLVNIRYVNGETLSSEEKDLVNEIRSSLNDAYVSNKAVMNGKKGIILDEFISKAENVERMVSIDLFYEKMNKEKENYKLEEAFLHLFSECLDDLAIIAEKYL